MMVFEISLYAINTKDQEDNKKNGLLLVIFPYI